MRKIIVLAAAAAALLVSACNTIEGVGRDVSAAGRAVADTARDAKEAPPGGTARRPRPTLAAMPRQTCHRHGKYSRMTPFCIESFTGSRPALTLPANSFAHDARTG